MHVRRDQSAALLPGEPKPLGFSHLLPDFIHPRIHRRSGPSVAQCKVDAEIPSRSRMGAFDLRTAFQPFPRGRVGGKRDDLLDRYW